MFRPRMRRARGGSLPLVMLAMRVFSIGLEHIPPVTLFFLGANAAIHLDLLPALTPSLRAACLVPHAVVVHHEYARLVWSALFHASDLHLYYNLSSWLYKGRLLEPRLGSERFLVATLISLLGSSVLYVALATLLWQHAPHLSSAYQTCAVGFSAVLFSLKVILQATEPSNAVTNIFGIRVPTKYAYWVELLLIQVITPHASLLGHLCGILVGLAYVRITGLSRSSVRQSHIQGQQYRGQHRNAPPPPHQRPPRPNRFTRVAAPAGYRQASHETAEAQGVVGGHHTAGERNPPHDEARLRRTRRYQAAQ